MLPEFFIYVAVALNLARCAPYIWTTLRGETRPNRVGWLMWGLLPFITGAAQISGGVGLATLIVFASGLGPLTVFFVSFVNKKAYWKTTPFDYACMFFSVLGVVGWGLTNSADLAIAFYILADIFAGLPTLRKAWTHPDSENGITYLIGTLANTVGLLAIPNITFTSAAFVVYLVAISNTQAAVIYSRRKVLQGSPP